MTPSEVLSACKKACISLQINAEGQLACEGRASDVTRLLPAVREHKSELLRLLGYGDDLTCALNNPPDRCDQDAKDGRQVEAERLKNTSASGNDAGIGIANAIVGDRSLQEQPRLSPVSRSEEVSESTTRGLDCAALAKTYNRKLVWIENGLKACAAAGVSPEYFVQRHLEGDKSIPLDTGVDQAFWESYLRRCRKKV